MIKKAWINFCALSVLMLISTSALADLTLSDGGASGQWFNVSRDGEGIFLEIVDTNSGPQVAIAWFTYDKNGNQMWLSGAVSIGNNATSANIPVIVTEGPVFGLDYDPDDLEVDNWGDLQVRFTDCSNGFMTYASSTGFGTGTIPLVRLTSLIQVECVDPDPPTTPQITPGRWSGNGVCFHVSSDGETISEVGTTCGGKKAFDSDVPGETPVGEDCDANAECHGVWPIVDGTFTCYLEASNQKVVGSFSSGTMASGTSQESEAFDSVCTGSWSATPD